MADRPTAPIAYLSALCRRWGGELLLLNGTEFSNLFHVHGRSVHPLGHHAIDVAQRLVIVSRGRANPGTIVHEMGHVFLEEGDPDDTYEPDWLGWEIALARRAGCYNDWSRQNAAYTFLDGREREIAWSDLAGNVLQRMIADRIDYAQALGIVSQDGEPLCTRLP